MTSRLAISWVARVSILLVTDLVFSWYQTNTYVETGTAQSDTKTKESANYRKQLTTISRQLNH